MKLSFLSTMRKAVVALTIATLGAASLAATPANAAAPEYATGTQLYESSANVSTNGTDNEIVVPAGSTSLNFNFNYQIGPDFFTTNKDKVISVSAKIFGPDGTEQTGAGSTATVNINPNLNFCVTNQQCDFSNWQTKTLTAKATHTSGNIYVDVMAYMMGDMFSPVQTPLAAGKYTVAVQILADGVEVPVTTSINDLRLTQSSGRYWVDGLSYTSGQDVRDFNFTVGACVDSTKVVAGDTVTLKAYVNDVETSLTTWNVYNYTRGSDSPSPRQNSGMNSGNGTVITANDIDYGLAMRGTIFVNSPVLGTNYIAAIALVDQDGNNVAGDCAPPAPSTPTISLGVSGSLSANVTGIKFAMDAECAWFDIKDMATPVATTWPQVNMPNTPQTCTLSSSQAVPGVTYVLKTRGVYYSVNGAYSEASNQIKVPVPGYTINPAVSGGDNGGQASEVSSTIETVSGSSNVRFVNKADGGAFRISTSTKVQSCPPCGPSQGSFKLQATSAKAVDSTFAGTGSVAWTPSGANATFANASWYGTSRDKWTLASSNYTQVGFTGQLQFIQGSNSSATTTETTVAGSVLDAACASVGSGYSTKMNAQATSVNISPVSAATAKQLFALTCYKPTTLADSSSAYLANPVLVTIDNATTVNVVKALGESTNVANGASAVFTANVAPGANDVALTVLVTKKLVTGSTNNMGAVTETGNNAGREIVRFKSDLTSTTTTAGWETGTTTIATEPYVLASNVNDGSFYTVLRVGLTNKLMKISATGVATTAVEITNDKATDMPGANISIPLGLQSGSLSDITLTVSSQTAIAPLSVKTATGAGKAGEVIKMSFTSGPGTMNYSIVDSATKDVYWWFSSTTNEAGTSSLIKWRDPLYVKPTGPVPAVTAVDLKYATNTPAAGTKVTFTGTNLDVTTAVKFGSVAATIGTKTATSLQVTVPAGSTGTVSITLESANGNGNGGDFTYVGANKVAQAVTLNSGSANAAVGDADRTLSATVSMTGYTAVANLTYSSTTTSVCTVTGSKLKFVAKGTCTVKATQAGSSWTAEGVATANIAVSGPADQMITVRAVQVGEKQINPDGFFLYPESDSGLAVKLVFSTPAVCKKGTYSPFHVINVKTGSCKISIVQEGDAQWAPATKLVAYTVTASGSKKFVDLGNVGKAVALGSSGAKTSVLSEVLSFKKATGALTISSKGVWVGPIVATATFKIDGKNYSCTVKYGTLKAVSAKAADDLKTFAADAAFCATTKSTDKAATAALKKATEPVNVKITVWRDLRNPVKYATKGPQIERAIYVTVG